MTYLDPVTGEAFAGWQEGCVEITQEPEEERQEDAEWLGDWYTQQTVRIEAERRALKAQHKIRLAQLDSREKGLAFSWGERFERVVLEATSGTKKRSVNYAYGTAGFRRSKRVEVTDKDAAIDWAEDYCPAAVKVSVSLLKSELPADQEVPGVERIERDDFFVRGAK